MSPPQKMPGTRPVGLPNKGFTIRNLSTRPAAWALSSTSRARNPTRSSARRSRCCINLDHRGACGCEANTGDGAGILMQMPHAFFKEVCRKDKIQLPAAGRIRRRHGVPAARRRNERRTCERIFEDIVAEEGQRLLGWRDVPTNNASLGADRQGARAVHAAGFHRAATPSWPTTWPSSASSTSSASGRSAPSATARSRAAIVFTSPACPARPWFTRACC